MSALPSRGSQSGPCVGPAVRGACSPCAEVSGEQPLQLSPQLVLTTTQLPARSFCSRSPLGKGRDVCGCFWAECRKDLRLCYRLLRQLPSASDSSLSASCLGNGFTVIPGLIAATVTAFHHLPVWPGPECLPQERVVGWVWQPDALLVCKERCSVPLHVAGAFGISAETCTKLSAVPSAHGVEAVLFH